MRRNYIASLLLVTIVATMLAACGGGSSSGSNYGSTTHNNATTSAATSNTLQAAAPLAKPQFIMFSTVWCPVCQQMRPIVGELKTTFGDRVDFQEINREAPANAAIVANYGVNVQPIFVLLDRKGDLVQKIIGGTDKTTLTAALNRLGN